MVSVGAIGLLSLTTLLSLPVYFEKVHKEHGDVLKEHRDVIKEHRDVIKKHGDVLKKHHDVVEEPSHSLKKHGDVMKEYGADFKEHCYALEVRRMAMLPYRLTKRSYRVTIKVDRRGEASPAPTPFRAIRRFLYLAEDSCIKAPCLPATPVL